MIALSAKCLFLISLLNVLEENVAQYIPPTPVVEPLYPKGLRMSIPHEDGISLVAYHVKFNNDFEGLEAGTIARDIVKTRNGRWTYEDRTTRLKKGDIIYYWIHVAFGTVGYNLLNKQYVVNDFYNYDGSPITATTPALDVCSTPSETIVFEMEQNSNHLIRHNVCPGQLIFEENFDSFNRTRWEIVERYPGAPSYEFVVYMNTEENVDVKDGALHIKPVLAEVKFGQGFVKTGDLVLNRCTGEVGTAECKHHAFGSYIQPPVISGRINTKPSFTFLYGHVVIRAKMPRGDWIYPVITLESREKGFDNSTSRCDILVAFTAGNPSLTSKNGEDISGRVLIGGAHVTDRSQNLQKDNRDHLPSKHSNSLWSNEYHVYELSWRNDRIWMKVDGDLYGEQGLPAICDTPVYLNVGLAVGGHTFFPDMSVSGSYTKPWRNVASKALYNFYLAENSWLDTWKGSDTGLHIDYIKVTAL